MFKFLSKLKNKKYAASTLMYMKYGDDEVKYCHTIHYVTAPDDIDAKRQAVELAEKMQPDYEITNVIILDITKKV